MSQNGRREFLTSAAAAAAALAACSPKLGGDQVSAQPAHGPCGAMYDEQGIVHNVAPHLHDAVFRQNLLTFDPIAIPSPTMADLTQPRVAQTLSTLNSVMISTVTVTKNDGSVHGPPPNILPTAFIPTPTALPLGSYNLIPWNPLSPTQPGSRSPVVLSLAQYMAITSSPPPPSPLIPDWTRMLMFVIPVAGGPGGPDPGDAMCAHPFGM
jgi:hypothetical protein